MSQEPDDNELNVLSILSHRVSPSQSVDQVEETGLEMVASCAASNQAVLYRYRVVGCAPEVFLRRLIQ